MVKSVVEPIATLPTEASPSFRVAQSKGLLVHHKVIPWHFIDHFIGFTDNFLVPQFDVILKNISL